MFAQRRKTGDGEGNGNEKEQRPRINMYHITCNDCGEKGQYYGNSEYPTPTKLKEDAESSIQEDETGKIFQQSPWWRRLKIIGKRQRRFVQSHDGIPHRWMGQTTISWNHVYAKPQHKR